MREQDYLEGFINFENARNACETLDRPAHARALLEWSEHVEASARVPHWRDKRQESLSLAIIALLGEDVTSGLTERLAPTCIALGNTREFLKAPSAIPPRTTPKQDPKVAALENRVQKLESLIEHLLAKQIAEHKHEIESKYEDEGETADQPHTNWIEANKDKLRAYPDSFVALDLEEGIVAHASDGDEFHAQLDKLSPEQRDRVVLFHTSMYVR
ncbi:hypothetical protein [Sorangium sp. So ce1097]|uniref:hypothetical protein n=1 Tax=Sorangium sp. So ce1097 TaxID=3133330 RepID=UPI003F5E45E6